MSENENTSESQPQTRRQRRASRRNKDVRTAAHIDGSALWSKLKNADPNKKYIWAYEGSSETGAEHYYNLGYEYERVPENPEDGPQPGGRRMASPGEVYRSHGHALMSIAVEEWEDIQQHGDGGQTGQARSDFLEQRIRSQRADAAESKRLHAYGMTSKPYFKDD